MTVLQGKRRSHPVADAVRIPDDRSHPNRIPPMRRTVLSTQYSVLSTLLLAATSYAADKPVPVTDAAARMTVPEGFRVTLFAGEPDVVQPIAMTFDDRGRMWV